MSVMTLIKEQKQLYRENFEKLKIIRSEIDYCTRLVDQCRLKLISEFEAEFEAPHGTSSRNNRDTLTEFKRADQVFNPA